MWNGNYEPLAHSAFLPAPSRLPFAPISERTCTVSRPPKLKQLPTHRKSASVEDGVLPKRTTQKIADALKTEIQPLNVLRILRRGIPREFLLVTHAGTNQAPAPPRSNLILLPCRTAA